MMRRRIPVLLALLFSVTVAYSQQRSTPPSKPTYTLSFESGIVMKSGDVKTIAREDFYLLDSSLADIRELEWATDKSGVQVKDGPSIVGAGLMLKMGSMACPTKDATLAPLCPGLDAFRKHVIASTVSDFSGKGKLTVAPGVYYLFSYVSIGGNQIVWNVRVNLAADQSIVLDNRNASGII